MKRILLSLSLVTLSAIAVHGQVISRMDSIVVYENGQKLRNPDAGGFNVPEFSDIDLDGDGIQDLFVYDRSGRKVITFLNGGTANQIDYDFAPAYVDAFPTNITDFALLADYNCDGKADLFLGTSDGIQVFENTSTPGNLSFQLYQDTLFTNYGAGPAVLFLYPGDIPALEDIDFDGDLDVLAFDPGGSTVEWHKNMVQENTGSCDGIDLTVADRCWGHFQESGLNQTLTLGITCRAMPGNPHPVRPTAHSGSSLAAFDEDADGDYELVIGDLLYDGLTYTHNAGTAAVADVDTTDPTFPSYDAPVALDIFAAGYFVDVDNDGKEDMLAAANSTNTSVNYDNSWLYKNIAPTTGYVFTRDKKNFLTEEMIDVGLGAYPVLFDYNSDGLDDLIIGNYTRKLTASNISSSLVSYENTGTATAPEFTLTNRNYANLTGLLASNPYGLTPTFGDMDADGDKDMLVGDVNGNLHYFENTAASGQPAIFATVVQDYMSIDIGQFSTPVIVDIDRDGKMDLVVGEMSGTLNYFHNTGTAQVAAFAATPDDDNWGAIDVELICCTGFSIPFIFTNPASGQYDMIVGSESGNLGYYKDFESELGGAFTLDVANFGDMNEGGRTAITGKDITGDGVWEWLVGNVRGGIGFYSGNGPVMTSTVPAAELGWEAYPNPNGGLLHVRLRHQSAGELRLSLLDLQGRVHLTQSGSAATTATTIDLRALAAGVYFLRLEVGGQFAGVKRIDLVK